jgi:hypothetical protein
MGRVIATFSSLSIPYPPIKTFGLPTTLGHGILPRHRPMLPICAVGKPFVRTVLEQFNIVMPTPWIRQE